MENDLFIGFVQTEIFWEDPEKNIRAIEAEINRLNEPVNIILLPEMFTTGFSVSSGKHAEPVQGPAWQFLKAKAHEKNSVIIGSILTEEGGKYFNRLTVMYPDGRYYQYDKRHLFRMGQENKVLTAGNQKIIVNINGWNILPLVCYDLRFPVWSMNRLINGSYEYDLLVYVANWPKSRHHAWKSLMIARAIENQAFVAGVNRIGRDGDGTEYDGESMMIDAKGRIQFAAEKGKPFSGTFGVSKSTLDSFRKSFPVGYDWDQFTINI